MALHALCTQQELSLIWKTYAMVAPDLSYSCTQCKVKTLVANIRFKICRNCSSDIPTAILKQAHACVTEHAHRARDAGGAGKGNEELEINIVVTQLKGFPDIETTKAMSARMEVLMQGSVLQANPRLGLYGAHS